MSDHLTPYQRKWRKLLKYPKPIITYNIQTDYYPSFIVDFIKLCRNQETKFEQGIDGEEYAIVRLETSKKEEDGFLVWVRRSDLYLLVIGMVKHGIFQFRNIVKDGKDFGYGEDYNSLGGIKNVSVGVRQFNIAIQRLVHLIGSDKVDLERWKGDISRICVFVPESARNKYVLYDMYKRNSGCISFWSPILIGSWESCSHKAYECDPEKNEARPSDDEIKLIECLAEFDPKIVDGYIETIKDSPLVCRLMLAIPWGYLAKHRVWNAINPILSKNKGGMDLNSIQSKLEKQKDYEYKLPICQLKNVLWELTEEKKIEHKLGGNYKKTHEEAPVKRECKASSSSSSGNRKGLLNVVLLGAPHVGKSALRKQFTAQEDEAHFETDNTQFTILDVDRQGQESSIPNIISRADIGVLVISSLEVEFDDVFVKDGSTSRLLRLAKIYGVSELLIAVNKMDHESVQWSPKRYNIIVSSMEPFLERHGYTKEHIKFLPIAGCFNQNVRTRVDKTICTWYDDVSLFEALDVVKVPLRDSEAGLRFRMPISDKYGNNGTIVVGKVDYGIVKTGDKMLIMPNNVPVTVSEIYINKDKVTSARPGETVRVQVKGVKETDISAGCVLCSSENPRAGIHTFTVKLYIHDLQNAPFEVGSKFTLHVHSLTVECEVLQLICEEYQQLPVTKRASVTCRIKATNEIYIEEFQHFQKLGAIVMCTEGKLVAYGRVKHLT